MGQQFCKATPFLLLEVKKIIRILLFVSHLVTCCLPPLYCKTLYAMITQTTRQTCGLFWIFSIFITHPIWGSSLSNVRSILNHLTIEYWKITVAIFPSRRRVFPSELLKLSWQSPLLANTRKYWLALLANTRKYWLVELAQYGSVYSLGRYRLPWWDLIYGRSNLKWLPTTSKHCIMVAKAI